jgi:hypothetical protein
VLFRSPQNPKTPVSNVVNYLVNNWKQTLSLSSSNLQVLYPVTLIFLSIWRRFFLYLLVVLLPVVSLIFCALLRRFLLLNKFLKNWQITHNLLDLGELIFCSWLARNRPSSRNHSRTLWGYPLHVFQSIQSINSQVIQRHMLQHTDDFWSNWSLLWSSLSQVVLISYKGQLYFHLNSRPVWL